MVHVTDPYVMGSLGGLTPLGYASGALDSPTLGLSKTVPGGFKSPAGGLGGLGLSTPTSIGAAAGLPLFHHVILKSKHGSTGDGWYGPCNTI